MESFGPSKWNYISTFLPGRIGKQCRERWCNHLSPFINKSSWSEEEELILFILHKRLGNKLSLISHELVGRTDNTIKNHWNSAMKKKIDFIQKQYNDLMNLSNDSTMSTVSSLDVTKEEDLIIEKMKIVVDEKMKKIKDEKRKAYEKFKKMKIDTNSNASNNNFTISSKKIRKVLGFRTHSKKCKKRGRRKTSTKVPSNGNNTKTNNSINNINLVKSKQKENEKNIINENINKNDVHSAFKNYNESITQTPINSDINKIVLFSKLATSAHSPFNYPVQTKPIQIIWDNNVNASPTFTHDPTPKKNLDNMFLETLHTQKK